MTKPTYRKRYLEFKTKYGRIKEAMNSLKLNYDKLKIKYDRKEQRCVTLEKGMEDLRVRLAKDMEDLRVRLAKAEGRLAQHDNPHMPSSKKPIGQKNNGIVSDKPDKPEGKPKKPGAQKGHPGVTSRPKPTKFKTHMPEMCPACGTSNLEVTNIELKDITDIPPKVKAVTTQHTTNTCRCLNCGRSGIELEVQTHENSEDPQSCAIMGSENKNEAVLPASEKISYKVIPSQGRYGRNLVTEAVNNFVCRMPHRMNAAEIMRYGISMATGTIHNILSRTGKNMGTKALHIMESIKASDLLHVDETSFSLNGKNVWVWIFFNPRTGETLYVIRESRGKDVIREVLGDGWKGTIVCDGWTAYKGYNIQRCWAHILREIRDVVRKNPDCQEAKQMLRVLTNASDAQEMSESQAEDNETFESRHKLYKYLRRRIRGILKIRTDCEDLQKFRTKLGNAYEDLFGFILDPDSPNQQRRRTRAARDRHTP